MILPSTPATHSRNLVGRQTYIKICNLCQNHPHRLPLVENWLITTFLCPERIKKLSIVYIYYSDRANISYMNNFIVPIDFSDASKNAARYAAHLANGVADAHIILYNVFDALEYGSDSSPLGTDAEEDASRKAIVELALGSV